MRCSFFVARMTLGAGFVAAGAIKYADIQGFSETIRAFGLMPRVMADVTAITLPGLEIALGAGVWFGSRMCTWATAWLLIMFMAVLGYGVGIGLDVDCGCYGPGETNPTGQSSLRAALWRDAALLIMAGFLLWASRNPRGARRNQWREV